MNKLLEAVIKFFTCKNDDEAALYCENSPTKEHKYEWNKYLVPARAIQQWSRLDTQLKCHYCESTVGPQLGSFMSEEV